MLFSKDSAKETKPEPLRPTFDIIGINWELTNVMNRGSAMHCDFDWTTLKIASSIPKKKVWIYNVSSIEHEVDHPIIKTGVVPAKKEGEDYAVVTSLPEIVAIPKDNPDLSQTNFALEDGKRLAMDFINPDNLGLDQNLKMKRRLTSSGRNLSDSGVFWSMHNPPLKTELKVAVKRMETHYAKLNMQALAITMLNPGELCGLSPEHREAYRYMQEKITTQEKTQ